MRIYAIYDVKGKTFVKWGVNGGGAESYCRHRGKPCFFTSLPELFKAVTSFGNLDDYEIRVFEEVRA